MNEKALIQSVIQEKMPDYEAVRMHCIRSQGRKKGLPVYRFAFVAAACFVVILGIYFLDNLTGPELRRGAVDQKHAELAKEEAPAMPEAARDNALLKQVPQAKGDEPILAEEKRIAEGQDYSGKEKSLEAMPESNRNIIVNKTKTFRQADLDVKVVEKGDEILRDDFAFLTNITLPEDLTELQYYEVYAPKDSEDTEYSVLHDYQLRYRNEDAGRWAKITFSPEFSPLMDTFPAEDNIQRSYIGSTELMILSNGEVYRALFEYRDISFDVESRGLTEEEFILLLQSLITE